MITLCQRWRSGRDSWRPAGELFQPDRHEAQPVYESDAKQFTVAHHYSGSYPAARFRVGLFRAGVPGLAGVAVFSVPMNDSSLPKYCGVEPRSGAELGRFVLLDSVEANGESWFLGQAFRLLAAHRPEIRAILSYADPVPRSSGDGAHFTPGHVGTIYQAFNGRYMGRTDRRVHILTTDGRIVPPRALSKLRNGERGAGHVYQLLRDAGAPPRRPLEADRAYVVRALRDGPFRRFAHPGNHRYAWALGDRRQRAKLLASFAPVASKYPKAGGVLFP